MKILIGICSAVKNVERRAAVRDTWLHSLPSEISAFFFVGSGGDLDEQDVIHVDAPDDYKQLPLKVQTFYRHILECHQFDYAFKCDDDTYVNGARLLEFVKHVKVDFVGSPKLTELWTQGGAGYLMNRETVQYLAYAEMPHEGPEDYYVSEMVKASGRSFEASVLFQPYCKEWPGQNTDYITAHHCSPHILRYIHSWVTKPEELAVISSYAAYHVDWTDTLTLRANGLFCLSNPTNASGIWEIDTPENRLHLRWFRWGTDVLTQTGGGFISKRLRLVLQTQAKLKRSSDPMVLTRVCIDDFDIFRIWTEYYQRKYTDIRCCIFHRPHEDITEIIRFCNRKGLKYIVVRRELFDNGPTYEALTTLSGDNDGRICLNVDCDEFVSNFYLLETVIANMQTDSVILRMVDRVCHDVFYDISQCKSYEDLCAVAPLYADITGEIQKWATTKCCINTLPDLGRLHYPSEGKTSQNASSVHLDHFKWRREWLPKARRRLNETRALGSFWERGLRKVLKVLETDRPKRYLTIPGEMDYEEVYEEQCRVLSDGAVLVEVGVWRGRSIAFLAECAKKLGKHFKIFGVDLFEDGQRERPLREGCTYEDTTRNLKSRELHEHVTLIRASTATAAALFANESIDFVWLDSHHSLENVAMDIITWRPRIKAGGTLGGRDLPFYHVADALARLQIDYVQVGTSWIVRNVPASGFENGTQSHG